MADRRTARRNGAGNGNVVALRCDRPFRAEAYGVPEHVALRRAALMIEGAAFEMATRESAAFVSRLIEIAAELDRISVGSAAEIAPFVDKAVGAD